MNKYICYYIILTLVMISTAIALEPPSENRSRFSGRIEAGGFYANSDSQVIAYEVSGIDKRIENLGKSESELSFGAPLILFDVNYELSDDVLIYFGTPFFMDSREGLSLGAELLLNNNSVLDISVFGDSSGIWQDPYLTGEDRAFTYSHKAGLNLMFSDIMGTDFLLNYVASVYTVDDDISGDNDARLKREGLTQKIKPGYTFNLNKDSGTALISSLIYERNESEGKAYTYDKAGLELSLAFETNQNSIVFSAVTESLFYNNKNPVFNKKVRDTNYSGSFIFSRKNLLETDWYLRVGGGLDYLDSNVNFFDHVIYIVGLTMGYSFE